MTESRRPKRSRPFIPVADRGVSRGCARFGRSWGAWFIFAGAVAVSSAWSGRGDNFFPGLIVGALGVLVWTRTIPRTSGPRAHPRLSERPSVVGWTTRRVVLASVSVVFLAFSPGSCMASSSTTNPTLAFVLGYSGFALGLTGWILAQPSRAANWYRGRLAAMASVPRPDETWTWDHAWNERGERRSFVGRLTTRRMFAGAVCALYAALAAPIPGTHFGTVLVKFALGGAAAVWAWRAWVVLGMGNVFTGFMKFPVHPGERVVLTIGVSDGGVEIREVTFALRHFRESRDGGDAPVGDATIEPVEAPRSDTISPGADQVIAFDVPAEAPGTSIRAAHPSYWELEVRGRTHDGEYTEWFLVPVYARPISQFPDADGAP